MNTTFSFVVEFIIIFCKKFIDVVIFTDIVNFLKLGNGNVIVEINKIPTLVTKPYCRLIAIIH
ncbi:hypothetical protein C9I90_19090 [Photobacterium aphoticum]|uniref:Uncharacterized protein n=1 Tax=Photobacterium aphoticum TaxID=754436 RepID=A0A0J1GH55_9GAMM|nr:hypothetical protein ABT58_18635 [Photobacterium aphoticum]PSU54781.1 hypothetical protein C9I90_19090 [Photobacterium aphoticum]